MCSLLKISYDFKNKIIIKCNIVILPTFLFSKQFLIHWLKAGNRQDTLTLCLWGLSNECGETFPNRTLLLTQN